MIKQFNKIKVSDKLFAVTETIGILLQANKDDRVYLQYCEFCKGYKSPRAHHCRKCNRLEIGL